MSDRNTYYPVGHYSSLLSVEVIEKINDRLDEANVSFMEKDAGWVISSDLNFKFTEKVPAFVLFGVNLGGEREAKGTLVLMEEEGSQYLKYEIEGHLCLKVWVSDPGIQSYFAYRTLVA